MQIPWQELQPATLDNLIEEFVTREGTDYGELEYSLADKVAQVRRQIERGEVLILFDADSESCQLLRREDLPAADG